MRTSNCCLQIWFCALNCDIQIVIYKSCRANSVLQIQFSHVLYPVGLVTEFSARKNGGRYSHRTQELISTTATAGLSRPSAKPKRDVCRRNGLKMTKFDFFALMASLLALSQWQTLFSSAVWNYSRIFTKKKLVQSFRSLFRNIKRFQL